MNLSLQSRAHRHGYALIVTMALMVTMLIIFASMVSWTCTIATMTQRNNQYLMSQAAAEAMTEVVMGNEMHDYSSQNLNSNLSVYTTLALPSASQTNGDGTAWPVKYLYTDSSGNSNAVSVFPGQQLQVLQPLGSEYGQLMGYPWFWTNIVTATPIGTYTVPVTVTQVVNFSSVPVFQYAIFYNLNLEIDPGAAMFVNGPVWSNAGIWAGSGDLTFNSTVSAVGVASTATADPFCCSKTDSGTPAANFLFPGQPSSGNTPIILPIAGANMNATNVEAILNIPPAAYSMGTAAAYSTNGQIYLANACDLIISNATWGISTNPQSLTIATKCTNNIWIWYQDQYATTNLQPLTPDYYVFSAAHTPATGSTTNWISGNTSDTNRCYTNVVYAGWSFVTNALFYDYRESAYVQAVSLNVTNFSIWLTNAKANGGSNWNNTCYQDKGHHYIDGVWVYNAVPPVAGKTLPGVRVFNGAQLPPTNGLTVATPMPVYVWGDYNKQTDSTHVSSGTNTAGCTYPAALMGDAVTLLSASWSDAYLSSATLASRTTPVATTLNAACLEGIVQSSTNTCAYSGGTENFLRFLENWGGGAVQTTYNGSIVVMFPSLYATNVWNGNVYGVPKRNWGFDFNFTHQNCLPPMTPCLKKTVRVSWAAN